MTGPFPAPEAARDRALDRLDLFQRYEAGAQPPLRYQGRSGSAIRTAAMCSVVAELRPTLDAVAGGGGEASRARRTSRGKMLARQRVDLLIDPGTAFRELSPLAAYGLYGGEVHSASIITGVGRISGRECVVVANDATIKGGTYYPMTVKKHLRAQDIARQ